VYEQLKQGMSVLIQHENKFKSMLLAEILFLVDNLEPCTYNAEPEVADSLHLSLDQLKDLIARIQDDSVINANAVRGIEQQVRDLAIKNDLRTPKTRSFLSRFTSPTVATPATPVASAAAVPVAAMPSPAPFVSAIPSGRPERSWMDPIRRMFTPRNQEWQTNADDRGVSDRHINPRIYEAYQPEAQPVESHPVEAQPVKRDPGKPNLSIGGRKTRRKV
jgi:hypothetical protein